MIDHLAAYVALAALLTLSPGPDMAVMLRNALRGGRAVVVPTAVGTCSSLLVWGAASSLGVAAILAASAGLYQAVRLAGAAYLVLLGVLALRAAMRGNKEASTEPRARGQLRRRPAFRSAFLTNILNPKVGVFYVAVLPQFVAPGAPVFVTSMLLASIHAGLCLVWLTVYGLMLSAAREAMRGRRLRQALEAITGTVLVGFGIGVAVDAR